MAVKLPFAGLVRARMRERGVGLRELCRAVDVDPSYFSKVLADKRNPPSEEEVLRRIAEVLEMEAPRLVVAAGRIPAEWRRILKEDSLFRSVHHLAVAGTAAASAGNWAPAKPERKAPTSSKKAAPSRPAPPPRRSNWGSPRGGSRRPKELGAELL